MNNIDQYEFWYDLQNVVRNLDNLEIDNEVKWVKNFAFMENLNYDLQDINNLLEDKKEIGFKPIKTIKKKLG